MTKKQIDLEEAIQAKINDPAKRYEYPDPTPMAPPIGYVKQPSLHDQIRAMIRTEKVRQMVMEAGYETPEEADDFEVGDDYDPSTPYEAYFDPPLVAPTPPSPDPLKSAGAASGTSPSDKPTGAAPSSSLPPSAPPETTSK